MLHYGIDGRSAPRAADRHVHLPQEDDRRRHDSKHSKIRARPSSSDDGSSSQWRATDELESIACWTWRLQRHAELVPNAATATRSAAGANSRLPSSGAESWRRDRQGRRAHHRDQEPIWLPDHAEQDEPAQ